MLLVKNKLKYVRMGLCELEKNEWECVRAGGCWLVFKKSGSQYARVVESGWE